ncbi:hypothetical protein MUK42_11117 [Musa troglodytarum]|uniref:Uncharacterized protein n=1 Tax=Musa troglodytarum TaxID=320322 RepID=A0A9E7H9T2_9LILI|nr:hypothetical protein MUK42_11117 [Musa troglodytarum]
MLLTMESRQAGKDVLTSTHNGRCEFKSLWHGLILQEMLEEYQSLSGTMKRDFMSGPSNSQKEYRYINSSNFDANLPNHEFIKSRVYVPHLCIGIIKGLYARIRRVFRDFVVAVNPQNSVGGI